MGKFGYISVLLLFCFCSGCAQKSQKVPVCTTFDESTAALQSALGDIAVIMENNQDPALAVEKTREWLRRSQDLLRPCIHLTNVTIQSMPPDMTLSYHERYLADPKVRRFLDAQDHFLETAAPDQIETFNELISPFNVVIE